jgi:outer membrane biosynthesis protein TonB
LPPEVTAFKPPATRKVVPETTPAPADNPAPTPVVEAPPPAPIREERTHKASAPAEAPKPAPVKAEAKTPTIVGSWQVAEMSHKGQVMPMPAGMVMTLTFAEGGTLSMTMTGAPGGAEAPARQGTYSASGGSISIDMDNDKKTGTLTFEGNDRAILDFEEARMTLTRSAG